MEITLEQIVTSPALIAFWFGILSAVSLPLGAIAGLWLKPSATAVAGIMAFGGGALLAALSFELVAEALEKAGFLPLALGSILGAFVFVILNQILNEKGAFLRKPATILKYLRRRRRAWASDVLARLSQVEIFRALPPKEVQAVLPFVKPCLFRPGQSIFEEGEVGDALYMIDSGEVDILSHSRAAEGASATHRIARLGAGETFGEMALLTGEARVATAQAVSEVKAWKISKDDFDRLVHASQELAKAVEDLMDSRLRGVNLQRKGTDAEQWHKKALKSIEPTALAPTPIDVRHAAQVHGGGAPLAIWLGILLDGIPESLVIGASLLYSAAISTPLILGLFLANLPESMSSAVGMNRQGYKAGRILWMWTSLMLMTGIGAFLGNIFFQNAPIFLFAFCEAAAAGAMLAMIAETMLPGAFEQGGHLVGIMTLLGFLCAIYVKTLETPH